MRRKKRKKEEGKYKEDNEANTNKVTEEQVLRARGGVAREGSYDDVCPQRVVLLGAVAHMTSCFYSWIIDYYAYN